MDVLLEVADLAPGSTALARTASREGRTSMGTFINTSDPHRTFIAIGCSCDDQDQTCRHIPVEIKIKSEDADRQLRYRELITKARHDYHVALGSDRRRRPGQRHDDDACRSGAYESGRADPARGQLTSRYVVIDVNGRLRERRASRTSARS